jgi:hypothetical protein
VIEQVKSLVRYIQLPREAKAATRKDKGGIAILDPGPDRVIREGVEWLCRAQDRTASKDGGVARDYSLVKGWATSYPETTGYIVPTMLDCARYTGNSDYRQRAEKMLDWLAAIQLPGGGFQGGKIDASPVVPVTFNTGQILIGLSAGVSEFDQYKQPAIDAANWLVDSLDDDGCWRRFPTPFAAAGEKAYETHVAWGLFEAEKVFPNQGYREAGLRQVRWALTKQLDNGWIGSCCLTQPDSPLTHTLGYALRGLIEAYDSSKEQDILDAALLSAGGLLTALQPNGSIAGRLSRDWSSAADWACLTGIVQIAHSWLLLYKITGDKALLDAGLLANSFVRRTIDDSGDPNVRGGVKGSFPVNGDYGTYEYLNWAIKFCIDSNLCEIEILANG